jgi:hypothetical protein
MTVVTVESLLEEIEEALTSGSNDARTKLQAWSHIPQLRALISAVEAKRKLAAAEAASNNQLVTVQQKASEKAKQDQGSGSGDYGRDFCTPEQAKRDAEAIAGATNEVQPNVPQACSHCGRSSPRSEPSIRLAVQGATPSMN